MIGWANPIGDLFQIGSMLVVLYGVWMLVDQWRVARWPRVHGRIIHSRWQAQYNENTRPFFRRIGNIAYRYRVNGVAYEGRVVYHPLRFFPGDSASPTHDIDVIETYLDGHSHGDVIDVIYRPDNPSDCLLEPSRGILPYIVIMFGTLGYLGAMGAFSPWISSFLGAG